MANPINNALEIQMYTSLNEAGKRHLAEELAGLGIELGADWDADATFADIEKKCTDVAESDDPRDYEISASELQFPHNQQGPQHISLLPEHFNQESVEA